MTLLAKTLYLTAAVAFLLAWVPIVVAARRKQSNRVSYLSLIILYLFMQIISGLGGYYYPLDYHENLWAWQGHRGLGFPTGYGVPICVVVLLWDTIINLRPQQKPMSDKQLNDRIAQELSEQAREKPRKDYW